MRSAYVFEGVEVGVVERERLFKVDLQSVARERESEREREREHERKQYERVQNERALTVAPPNSHTLPVPLVVMRLLQKRRVMSGSSPPHESIDVRLSSPANDSRS